MWDLIQQVVLSLLAVAGTIFFATWSGSPVRLPLPDGPERRWLQSVPLFATAAMIVVLATWFTDCSQFFFLKILLGIAFFLCLALLILHHHLLKTGWAGSTLLVIVCLGWSICGTLTISTLATIAIAKQRMDAAYTQHPLMLWRSNGDEKQIPPDFTYLHGGQSVHFKIEMDECHSSNAEIGVDPAIGELTGLTYRAPKPIKQDQEVTVTVRAPRYGDTKTATIILLPEPPSIVRHQYPAEDDKKRKAVFDFIIISNNHSWVIRSDQLIEENRLGSTAQSKPPDQRPVCKPILELAGAHMFDPYVDVISIGTASREGPRGEEEDRADRRSKKIAEWVNLSLANTNQSKHVYRMNLGQYLPDPGDQTPKSIYETAKERPVVIIGVLREGDIDLEEALRNVLAQHPENEFFRFLAQHYPGRELVPDSQLPETQCTE